VIVTLRVSGDPAAFEEQAAAQADAIGRIMEVAKRHGLIAHRWYGADGEYMAVDEWPDGESFQAFFAEMGSQIEPLMREVGVTEMPQPTFWRKLESHDEVGWGA